MKAHDDPDPDHAEWLIALAVASANSERAVRATITIIQSLCREHTMAVDLMTFVPDVPPGWVREVGIGPFYTRALGQRMRSEGRRVGKACVSTGRSRGSPVH